MTDAVSSLEQTLTTLLTPVVEGAGLFLERVETTRAGRYSTVRVVVDLPDGPGDLDLDALTEVTQAVSAALDEADPVKSQYQLEVSTPGAEHELTTPRHWRRAVGHEVEVTLFGDAGEAGASDAVERPQTVAGTLTAVSQEEATVEADGQVLALPLAHVAAARTTVAW